VTPAQRLTDLTWRNSSYSSSNGQCVETANVGPDVAVRDSKDPDGPLLLCTRAGMAAFIAAVKAGEFDLA
jgi:hypothetical protein